VSDLTAIVLHGGGPTAVLNASLAGVIHGCQASGIRLYGARFGTQGLLTGDVADLSQLSPARSDALKFVPGSALGSNRARIPEEDLHKLFESLDRVGAGILFYTGGNGSMASALAIHTAAKALGYRLQVIGIPKTIDNDLEGCDHTPGYGSAARFFAHAVRDIGADHRALPSPICVVETLGRNTGWIAAATALARHRDEDPPHLIYLPEERISESQLLADVESVYRRLGRVLIVVCEGQRDEGGEVFGAQVDRPQSASHNLASNLGHTLAQKIAAGLKLRARAEKPGLLGRSCQALVSEVDREESYACGKAAVEFAEAGLSGVMVAAERISGLPYKIQWRPVPLEHVAGREKPFPSHWFNGSLRENGFVLQEFLEWLRPLTSPFSPYPDPL
jgi:ATP-dependent phosphofructokinase / diphosphate-dependent phosphofructokinase